MKRLFLLIFATLTITNSTLLAKDIYAALRFMSRPPKDCGSSIAVTASDGTAFRAFSCVQRWDSRR